MSDKSGIASQVIPLPSGGGAVSGIGETFSPDLFTGTANVSVPIVVPPGRRGLQPQLTLGYSTGNGNGPFGLGWRLALPDIARKTSRGVPHYGDLTDGATGRDVFILASGDDLVPVGELEPGIERFRPRTEGLFASVERVRTPSSDFWRVRGRDGTTQIFGTPELAGRDPAACADPANPARVAVWNLSSIVDVFGNHIEFEYHRDSGDDTGRDWDQLYLERIRYVDHEHNGDTRYLASVSFTYEPRPDTFSNHRCGFETRTRLRCRRIECRTHAHSDALVRSYELTYLDDRVATGELDPATASSNGASLLSLVRVVGHDGQSTETMPPLEFHYTPFDPAQRRFHELSSPGGALPSSLAGPDVELVGLFGNGFPDLVEMNGTARFWRNQGNGVFANARTMTEVPAGIHLRDPGVWIADMDGDGRADLLSLQMGGYFPLSFEGRWSPEGFVSYAQVPSVELGAVDVRLMDVDGDGVVDAIRTGTEIELFLNDPEHGWVDVETRPRRPLAEFPDVTFTDPRVRLADVTGDGLQDMVLVDQARIDYWPYLGHGRWGRRVTMEDGPVFPTSPGDPFAAERVLFGDLDGDGLDDVAYVELGRLTVWINRGGERWSEPLTIVDTPPFTALDGVRLADLLGSGYGGVLWTQDRPAGGPATFSFLELGSAKPYLLDRIDNHRGAVTRLRYRPSTHHYLADEELPQTRWRTPMPFPVQVVDGVEVMDQISGSKATTEYHYHHGYWDGAEREFRGFGRVDQLDTESFEGETMAGLPAAPPTLTKSWFHLGPVGDEQAQRQEADFSAEYWPGDPDFLDRPAATAELLSTSPRRQRADALRSLRGSVLRTETYGLDGSPSADRPYAVTESTYGVRDESPTDHPSGRPHVYFPHLVATRTTTWERGNDPMLSVTFIGDYDGAGQPRVQTQVACPRGWRTPKDRPTSPYLATRTTTKYADPDALTDPLVDRVAATTVVELLGTAGRRLADLEGHDLDTRMMSQTVNYYDGPPFVGLPLGRVGPFGALVRSETLVLTEEIVQAVHEDPSGELTIPPYLATPGSPTWTADYPQEFRDLTPPLAGYQFSPGDEGRARGWFTQTIRNRFDFQGPSGGGRGLLIASRDPLAGSDDDDRDTVVQYDEFELLGVSVTDAAGLTTVADNDYRVLRPRRITDPNGNRTLCRYTPLGLLESTAIMGKPGQDAGDTADAPSVRFAFDLSAFADRGEPLSARTIRRVHHSTDPAGRDETIEVAEYSDGFGRVVQTRTQAEDVLFDEASLESPVFGHNVLASTPSGSADRTPIVGRPRREGAPTNVVVSGAVVYDNKGRVVERYEPFFSVGSGYRSIEAERASGREVLGRKIAMRYDPLGRLVATIHPDGSEIRAVLGVPKSLDDPDNTEPTPWESTTYDANDNGGRTHPDSSRSYDHQWDTPTTTAVDALGRAVETIERLRPARVAPGDAMPAIAELRTRFTYDLRGNRTAVLDPAGRLSFRQVYDLANRPLRTDSLDGGLRRSVIDAAGCVVERRDSKGALLLQAYDRLSRPTRLWARDDAAAPVTLRERLEYGDGGRPDQAIDVRSGQRTANRLGRLHRHFDEAGLGVFGSYDFAGNVLAKSRRVISDDAVLAVFPVPGDEAPDWRTRAFRVDWQPPDGVTLEAHSNALLDEAAYETTSTYDALQHVTAVQAPRVANLAPEVLAFAYNRAGALDQVRLGSRSFVERIGYDAAGHRTLIALADGTLTRHAYDLPSGRLARSRTERATRQPTAPTTYRPDGPTLQDFTYEHDLVGNVVVIADRTPRSGIRGNPDAVNVADPELRSLVNRGDALVRRFAYDSAYRLVAATGRECTAAIPAPPWADAARCGFGRGRGGVADLENAPELTSFYREAYEYNASGSLTRLRHIAGNGGFTRELRHFPANNQLDRVQAGAATFVYAHDANGNVTTESEARHLEWDHGDRMKAFRTQVGSAEPTIHVHYLCDSGGQRVKKLVRRQGGAVETIVYVDGMFEHHRWTGGENIHIHVLDKDHRIAIVRLGPAHPNADGPVVQIMVGDHLGSSSLVLDEGGQFVNREEYSPYGETTFGGFARKRYRFTGRERDEESGFAHHGARSYAPWLGRWMSCDSHGNGLPTSLYRYAAGNPMRFVDLNGLDENEPRLNLTLGLTFTWGSLEQNVSASASATTQVPIGWFGLEGGARADLLLFRRRMGVDDWGAVAGWSYFAGASAGLWNTTAGHQVAIANPTISFHGSGMTTSDRRVALGLGWTNFTDLQVSQGGKLLLDAGLAGHRLDQKIGHFYLRTDLEDQSARAVLGNDAFLGGTTDWFETMSVQLFASSAVGGKTAEFSMGVRALTDPIALKPDASGNLTRQHTGPEPGAPNGYYLTHPVGANHFPLYLKFSLLDPGTSLLSLSIGADEPGVQRIQEMIHLTDWIDAPFFRREAVKGLFWQIEAGVQGDPARGGR
jgi:RHS repeat-associated protein